MSHAAIILLMTRVRQPAPSSKERDEPLILMLLRDDTRARADTPALHRTPLPPRAVAPPRLPPPAPPISPPSGAGPTPPPDAPERPEIDWAREAESAVHNYIANADKQRTYRDLSALSPQQQDWIKKNHMQPMSSGIEWTHPRFEFDRHSGLPIFWINDHCVLVTLMVFCGIGKIPANGDLFKNMRDPHPP